MNLLVVLSKLDHELLRKKAVFVEPLPFSFHQHSGRQLLGIEGVLARGVFAQDATCRSQLNSVVQN